MTNFNADREKRPLRKPNNSVLNPVRRFAVGRTGPDVDKHDSKAGRQNMVMGGKNLRPDPTPHTAHGRTGWTITNQHRITHITPFYETNADRNIARMVRDKKARRNVFADQSMSIL